MGERSNGGGDSGAVRGGGRRWLKRAFLVLLVFGVAVPLGLALWGRVAGRNLAKRVEALRRAGQPTTFAELADAPLPDDQNAVVELRAAARLVDTRSPEWDAVTTRERAESLRLPLSAEELADLRAVLAANRESLSLLERAARKPGVNWQLTLKEPAVATELPDLNHQRTLANLLHYAALAAHQDGDDVAALRHVREIFAVGRAIDRQPFFISHLVALGVTNLGCDVAGHIAPDLRIGEGGGGRVEAARVRDLIDELLDEPAAHAALVRGIQSERVSNLNGMQALANGTWTPATGAPVPAIPAGLGRGYLLTNASAALQDLNAAATTAESTRDWPAFRGALPPSVTDRSPLLYQVARVLTPAMPRYVEQHYRVAAERRMAATALGAALYRARHAGAFPAKLEDLVPQDLPAVPSDPLAAGGKPLAFVADPKRPRVYSVGQNGIDDGGAGNDQAFLPGGRRAADDVLDLARQPKPAALTQPSEED